MRQPHLNLNILYEIGKQPATIQVQEPLYKGFTSASDGYCYSACSILMLSTRLCIVVGYQIADNPASMLGNPTTGGKNLLPLPCQLTRCSDLICMLYMYFWLINKIVDTGIDQVFQY